MPQFEYVDIVIGGIKVAIATKAVSAFMRGRAAPDDRGSLDAYTDAAFKRELEMAGCAVCVRSDAWPAPPVRVSAATLKASSTVFQCSRRSTNSYGPELHTIAHCLHLFPLSVSIIVITDSESSILKVLSFPSLTIRRQLRSEEHALLLFIHAAVAHRRGHGGDFAMMKVKAHSGATDLHSLGNDATDESAKKALENSVPLCSVDFGAFDFPHLISFDISKSILAPEHGAASVWEKCSGDPRRATRRYIQSVYLADWHASASQGAMARYVLSSPHSSSLHELALVAELVREFSQKRPPRCWSDCQAVRGLAGLSLTGSLREGRSLSKLPALLPSGSRGGFAAPPSLPPPPCSRPGQSRWRCRLWPHPP